MVATLNPDYELIYVDRETDKVFLKNQFFKNMVSLSTVEYEMIQYYSRNPDPQIVLQHFSQQYEMPSDFIYLLIQRAEASGLLMSESYLQRKEKVMATSNKRADNFFLYWLLTKLQSLLKIFGISAKLELRGTFKYYRLISFDLTNTWFERICSSRMAQIAVAVFYVTSLLALTYALVSLETYHLDWNYGEIGQSQKGWALIFLLLGIVVVTMLHEFGHFIIYKTFGGAASEMGAALMTGIIPTLYVTTGSLPLWKQRYQRILVMAAGCMVDVLLLILLLYVGYTAASGIISFYAFMFAFMQLYRIYFNSNPLIPRTDGYFIMCDLVQNPTFHSTAYANTIEMLKKMRAVQFNSVTLKELGYAQYFAFSMIFMVINYLMFLLPLTFFFL